MSQNQRMFKVLCMLGVGILVVPSMFAMDKRTKRSDRRFTMNARDIVTVAQNQQVSKKDHPIKQDPAYLARTVKNHEQKNRSNRSVSSSSSSSSSREDNVVSAVKNLSQPSIFDRQLVVAFDKAMTIRNEKEEMAQVEIAKKAAAKKARTAKQEKKAEEYAQKLEERNKQLSAQFAAAEKHVLFESWTPEQKQKRKKNPALGAIPRTMKGEDLSSVKFDLGANIELENGSEESSRELPIVTNNFEDATSSIDNEKENRDLGYSATKPALLRNDENKLARLQHRLQVAQDNSQFTGRLSLNRHAKELAKDARKNR